MASYFYLMSSLPMLRADGDMPITYEQFLSYCKDTVSKSNYDILNSLTVESDTGPLIKEWSKFYKQYKNELTFQRYKKQGKSVNASFDKDSEASKAIAVAIADKNPLNAEKTLLSLHFEKLDSLIGTHVFDDYALFGYALKLKLLGRNAVFDEKKGKKELNRLVSRLEEQIDRI